MFLVDQPRAFYPDLQSGASQSALANVPPRFSTNTDPPWARANPTRLIDPNGQVTPSRGQGDRMLAAGSPPRPGH